MAEITQLKSNNEPERNSKLAFLEKRLIEIEKYKKLNKDTTMLEIETDCIFSVEYTLTEKKRLKEDKKVGFGYIIYEYGDSKRCMDFFTKKYINELLVTDPEYDLEERMHDSFDTFDEFLDSNPNKYIIDIAKTKDPDLGNYLSYDISRISCLDNELERIKNNWKDYYEFKESIVFNKMKNKFRNYFEAHRDECTLCETEIVVYLAMKHDVLEKMSEYYKFDDPEETLITLAEDNDIGERLMKDRFISMGDINVIKGMDDILVKGLNKINKVQKLK